jgi:3-deoxy-manno-octulosonate cytidylyltransferase (CMP-KDO synthetase)
MEKMGEIVGFIPARAKSSRFPEKPLADILGKPMIVRVWERVSACESLSRVYVATDSERIMNAAIDYGAEAIMTYGDHASGSDRVAEASRTLGLGPNDIVVNVQGDQPLMDVEMIDEVVGPLIQDESIPMTTLIYRIVREEEIHHPNAVKTVFDSDGFALYFSRSTVPFSGSPQDRGIYFKHHGIYGFRNDFLQKFSQLPVGNLERVERLEQLRALENGFKIKVVITDKDSVEVDTPEDLERVRREYLSMA